MASIDLTPPETDLTIYRGNSVVFGTADNPCQWASGGSPVDMTGGTLLMQIRAKQDPRSRLFATADVTLVNPALGQFTVAIPASVTAGFNFTDAFWDMTFRDANTPSNVTTLTQGSVTVVFDVSN
jgi:hypothetical protein